MGAIAAMNWGTLASMAIILGGVFLTAWALSTFADQYLPEWAYYTLLVMAVAPFLWLGQQVDRLITSYLKTEDPEAG